VAKGNGVTAPRATLAPIFIIADDDREAVGRLVGWLPRGWYYVPVSDPSLVVKYAGEFAITAVFLSDKLDPSPAGVSRLLQSLLDEVGKPVVILAECWTPDVARRWIRQGAKDCVPHPTRSESRVALLRGKMTELIRAARGVEPGPAAGCPRQTT
jgi:hypothetical protein